MKKIILGLLLSFFLSTNCFASCDTTIDGHLYCDFEISDYDGISSTPGVSPVGQGRIYFDTSAGKLKCSENGAAYANCVSSGGGTWGSITGTLSNQTDLQSALDLKANLDSPTFTTFLKLPNGASPTVDAAGKIAQDTTDDQLLYGSTPRVITFHHQYHIPIANPTAGTYLIGKAIDGFTVLTINCIVDPADSGENTILAIHQCNSSGDSCANIDGSTITCSNTGAADDGAISSPTITAGNWWAVNVVSVSGTVTQAIITADYSIVRE